jgi:prepilin-type processing-associated H-X9-DG protein
MRRIKDGASKTVAVDELRAGLNPDDLRGCWAMPGLAAGTAALFGDANSPNAPGGNADDMENCEGAGLAGDGSQGMGCFDSDTTGQMAARSAHTGGVHVLMVDGSARFVNDDIDSTAGQTECGPEPYGVWQAMHTRAGGELIDES